MSAGTDRFLTEAGKDVLARAKRLEAHLEARLDAKLGPGGRQQLLARIDLGAL
jgi:hypothetical protein